MKRAVLSLGFLALAGCSSIPRSATNPALTPDFRRPITGMYAPQVLFVGDSITASWLTPSVLAAHQNFHVAPEPTDAQSQKDEPYLTSADLLTGFPGALASCPQCTVVEIVAGSWDPDSPTDYDPYTACDQGEPSTCANLQAMVADVQAAGKVAIVGTVPPWGPGTEANQLDDAGNIYEDIEELNGFILGTWGDNGAQGQLPGSKPAMAVVDYHLVLSDPNDEDSYAQDNTDATGIFPSAIGGQRMIDQLQRLLNAMGEDAPR